MRWLMVLAGSLVVALCGCGEGEVAAPEPDADGYTHTITLPTEYYESAPEAGGPPNGELPPKTRLRVLEEGEAWVLIEAEGGVRGYVSTGSYAPIGALEAPVEPLNREGAN